MSDIVERLREQAQWYSEGLGPLCSEAADEIERLRGALDIATLQIKSLGRTLEDNDLTYDWLPATPPKPSSKKNRL